MFSQMLSQNNSDEDDMLSQNNSDEDDEDADKKNSDDDFVEVNGIRSSSLMERLSN